jgi:hypothetical protein
MLDPSDSILPGSVKQQACRRDIPVTCPVCGRSVGRKARQQIYCSGRCRKRAYRAETAVRLLKKAPRYPYSGGETNRPKTVNGFNGLQRPKSPSSIPAKQWRAIVEVEIFGGRRWRAVVSSHGVEAEVANLRPCAPRRERRQ